MSIVQYVWLVLPELPVAFIVAVVWLIVDRRIIVRRQSRSWLASVCSALLLGWLVGFVVVTQIIDFGGLGPSVPNLVPLVQLRIAWQVGATNAQLLSQFYLNVLMCAPAGVLLPLTFRWKHPMLVSFLFGLTMSTATELVQWGTGRAPDIDDVIANTLGVTGGAALTILVLQLGRWCRSRLEQRHAVSDVSAFAPATDDHDHHRPWQTTLWLAWLIVIVVAVPGSYAALRIHEAANPYGYLFYGQSRPTALKLDTQVPSLPKSRWVYKVAPIHRDPSALLGRLSGTATSGCKYLPSTAPYERAQTACTAKNGDDLSVYDDGTWSYTPSPDRAARQHRLAGFQAARSRAIRELARLHLTPLRDMVFDPTLSTDDSGQYTILWRTTQTTGAEILTGSLSVQMSDSGQIQSVDDARVRGVRPALVRVISAQEAIGLSKQIGIVATGVRTNVAVSEIVEDYGKTTKGYLVPTWHLAGEEIQHGPRASWDANINATK